MPAEQLLSRRGRIDVEHVVQRTLALQCRQIPDECLHGIAGTELLPHVDVEFGVDQFPQSVCSNMATANAEVALSPMISVSVTDRGTLLRSRTRQADVEETVAKVVLLNEYKGIRMRCQGSR